MKSHELSIHGEEAPALGKTIGGFADSTSTKSDGKYRNYSDSSRQKTVAMCYKAMHENQTVAHVQSCREKYSTLGRMEMTIVEALKMLDNLVDDSDPDTDLPNSLHNFQTAERIRQAWPDENYD